jgi:hypothetical protein
MTGYLKALAAGAMSALVLVAGCGHQPPRIDCERHLVPINAPAAAGETSREPPVKSSQADARSP